MPFFYLAYAPFLSVLYYYRSRFIIGTYNRTTFFFLPYLVYNSLLKIRV